MSFNVLYVSGVDDHYSGQEPYRKALEKCLNTIVPGQATVYLFDPKPHFKRNWAEHLVAKVPLLSMTTDVLQYLFRYRGNAADEVDRAFLKELQERPYHGIVGHSLGTVIIARNACNSWEIFLRQVSGGHGSIALFQSPLWMPFWIVFGVLQKDWVKRVSRLFLNRLYVYSTLDWISLRCPIEIPSFGWDVLDVECVHDMEACLMAPDFKPEKLK